LAIPGKVLSINNKKAKIEILGVIRETAIDFVENVKVGDYLIVHAGCAIEKINEEEAKKTIELFREIEGIEK
jgi:hydrogenase expression/formation protein HypC